MFKAFQEGLSPKAKGILAVVLVVIIIGGSVAAYKLWDYKENNPNFCMTCHLMKDAFDKWSISEHKGVNCHECHHLTLIEQNMLLVNLVLHNPKEVPKRHGEIIVPWKLCTKCHVDKNEKFPNAVKIDKSPFHQKHFFKNPGMECTKCHGYDLHKFTPDHKFCLNCHKDKAEIHGMVGFACMNCHSDRTQDFKPNRAACLSCHGNAEQRAVIAKEPCQPTLKQCPPEADQIAIASKMTVFPEDGAMKFECSKCHNPHGKIKLTGEADCLVCHPDIKKKGKHQAHLDMQLKCMDCHKPHGWRVTKAMGKSAKCTSCHGPVDPANFLK